MFEFCAGGIDVSHRIDPRPLTVPEIAKHYHALYEIFCFTGGDAYITVEGGKTRLQAGDVIFIRPGQHHIVTLDRATPYERYVLKFPVGLVPEHITDRMGAGTAFFRADEELKSLLGGLDGLYERYYGRDLYELLCCRIREIAVIISRAAAIEKPRECDAFVGSIADYINANLRGELTMDMICARFGRSRTYIGSRFGRFMQTPVMQYVRTKKIVAAMSEIARGGKPYEVAAAYGYADYSAFYRAYVKAIGAPPGSRAAPNGQAERL